MHRPLDGSHGGFRRQKVLTTSVQLSPAEIHGEEAHYSRAKRGGEFAQQAFT